MRGATPAADSERAPAPMPADIGFACTPAHPRASEDPCVIATVAWALADARMTAKKSAARSRPRIRSAPRTDHDRQQVRPKSRHPRAGEDPCVIATVAWALADARMTAKNRGVKPTADLERAPRRCRPTSGSPALPSSSRRRGPMRDRHCGVGPRWREDDGKKARHDAGRGFGAAPRTDHDRQQVHPHSRHPRASEDPCVIATVAWVLADARMTAKKRGATPAADSERPPYRPRPTASSPEVPSSSRRRGPMRDRRCGVGPR